MYRIFIKIKETNLRKVEKFMDDLEIFNLYEQKSEKSIKEFLGNVNSSIRIQSDYEKVIEDTEWIEKMEETIPYIDNIFRNPNRFIINEEEIVKIELARKITVESIKHLSKNTNFIQDIDEKTGDVKPSKILNINKEESYETYENRFIYSLVQNMKFFISRKKRYIEERENINEKNNKQLEYNGKSCFLNEDINITLKLDTKLNSTKKQNEENILQRLENLEQKIRDLSSSEVYKILDKRHLSLVTSPIKKTNVILKNVNFQYAVKLWNYLQENIDDRSKNINEKKDYTDNDDIRRLMNENFFLNYLVISSLDKDKVEDEMIEKKLREETTNQMVEKIIALNSDMTKEQLKDMIGGKYVVVKYKYLARINEIQKIFKNYIEKYLEKIK